LHFVVDLRVRRAQVGTQPAGRAWNRVNVFGREIKEVIIHPFRHAAAHPDGDAAPKGSRRLQWHADEVVEFDLTADAASPRTLHQAHHTERDAADDNGLADRITVAEESARGLDANHADRIQDLAVGRYQESAASVHQPAAGHLQKGRCGGDGLDIGRRLPQKDFPPHVHDRHEQAHIFENGCDVLDIALRDAVALGVRTGCLLRVAFSRFHRTQDDIVDTLRLDLAQCLAPPALADGQHGHDRGNTQYDAERGQQRPHQMPRQARINGAAHFQQVHASLALPSWIVTACVA